VAAAHAVHLEVDELASARVQARAGEPTLSLATEPSRAKR